MISDDPNKRLELVAEGLAFPTSLTFDEAGVPYVAESGLPFAGAAPGGRIWRIGSDGSLYISEGGHPGRISRLDLDGRQTVILDNLPGPGNYHTNMAVFGPDGKLYFSQGSMTNTAIVGLDAYELGWLRRLPHEHDIPGYDIVLTGASVETDNPLSQEKGARIRTGAFASFGKVTEAGQRIPGQVPCTAAIMRCNP